MSSIAPIVAAVPALRYVKEEAMPCGQRISALLGCPELRDAAHFGGVLGGAGGRYLLDELARGAIGTMPACELADVHVALMRAWRDGTVTSTHARSTIARCRCSISRRCSDGR